LIPLIAASLNGVFGTLIWLGDLNFAYYSNACPPGTFFTFPTFTTPAQSIIFEADPNNSSSIVALSLPGTAAWNEKLYRLT